MASGDDDGLDGIVHACMHARDARIDGHAADGAAPRLRCRDHHRSADPMHNSVRAATVADVPLLQQRHARSGALLLLSRTVHLPATTTATFHAAGDGAAE